MDYATMRAIADGLAARAEGIQGGWTVEIGAGGPVMMMVGRRPRHSLIQSRVMAQIGAQLPATHPGHVCVNDLSIEDVNLGRSRIPDAVVVPEAALATAASALDASLCVAVVEIVSEGSAGIDLYLLIDPRDGTVHVHSEPGPGGYRTTSAYVFGEPVTVGPWTVATTGFLRYDAPTPP